MYGDDVTLNELGWPSFYKADYPWKSFKEREHWEHMYFSRKNFWPISIGYFNDMYSRKYNKGPTYNPHAPPRPRIKTDEEKEVDDRMKAAAEEPFERLPYVRTPREEQIYRYKEAKWIKEVLPTLRPDRDGKLPTYDEHCFYRRREERWKREWEREVLPTLKPDRYGNLPTFEDHKMYVKRMKRRREDWERRILPTLKPNKQGKLPTFEEYCEYLNRERRRENKILREMEKDMAGMSVRK